MVVESNYTVRIRIFAIHLLISGAQYIIGTLIYSILRLIGSHRE